MQKTQMLEALRVLDSKLKTSVQLIIGGGGALILAHGLPLVTHDIDAIPLNMDISELDPLIKQVAAELNLPADWMNPYFSTFTHTLPSDYRERVTEVFCGDKLRAFALGLDEMLIMKCFAHRMKDIGHAKALIKKGARVDFVENHIESLRENNLPGAMEALDFLDEISDES